MATTSTAAMPTMRELLRTGIGVPIGVLAVLAMVVLPLPPMALDVLFTFNIALSIVIMITGNVQIAHCWLMLHRVLGDQRYLEAASSANRFVRLTQNCDGPPETRGAIKGSFPVDGGYCTYQYPNWACKFFVDSHMLEQIVRQSSE